ncbi:MAG: hypothetical protein IPJ31_03465 [Bacteroidetes bacterium]|nr:hypothetical protein [Bacteroidota bacterium]
MQKITILFVFIFCSVMHTLDTKAQAVKSKYLYKKLQIAAEYQIGNFVSFGSGSIDTRTKYGQGAELSIKYRLSKNLSFNLGFHVRSYLLDIERYKSSLQALYFVNGAYISIAHYQSPSLQELTQFGFGPSIGRIFRLHRIRFEPYFKLNTTFSTYGFDSRVYVRNITTDEFRIYNVNGKRNQVSAFPALGLHFDVACTRLLSATLGLESGYSIGSQYFSTSYADGSSHIQNQNTKITTPKSYFLAGFGIVLRPFNRIKPSESEYSDEAYLKKFERNR